jgi:hypothetical protein
MKRIRALVRCPVCERTIQLRIRTTDTRGVPLLNWHCSAPLSPCPASGRTLRSAQLLVKGETGTT